MSHFVVGVITKNGTEEEVTKALAPFHEFECTGYDDEFVQDIDQTEETRKDWKNHNEKHPDSKKTFADFCNYWHSYDQVAVEQEPDLKGRHKYGYTVVGDGGEVVKVVRRTNPNRQWDWYSQGGRWSDMIPGDESLIKDLPPLEEGRTHWFWAVLTPEGDWVEKGRMGWWGMSSGDKDDWPEIEAKVLAKYPDHKVTVIDCHI